MAGILVERRAWTAIGPLLPKDYAGARRVDNQRIISSSHFLCLRSGCRWMDCPVSGPRPRSTIASTAGAAVAAAAGDWPLAAAKIHAISDSQGRFSHFSARPLGMWLTSRRPTGDAIIQRYLIGDIG